MGSLLPITRRTAVDVSVAVAVFALSLALLGARGDADTRELDPLGVLLVAATAFPLVAWRRAPLAVFAVTAAASAGLAALDSPPGPPLGPTVALFLLALAPEDVRAPRALTAGVVGALFLAHVSAVAFAEDEVPTVPLLFGTLVWGGAWVIGDRVRQRRERIAELEQRMLRAERDAERERRLAAAEERTRIARDLHDSTGHAINVILVQAGAARLLRTRDPGASEAAIETIEAVARETLGEIDQLVRVLRDDAAPHGEVEPPPGLSALDALVARQRAADLSATVVRRGEERPLPARVDQTAYRILQEALTNAARHGRGTAAVELDFGAAALELTVTNPSAANGAAGTGGHGLVGMRERAALVGGDLEAGARDGSFRVWARLPYDPGAER